ncbi:hypothetical protein [Sphingomonas immobilis]|uniref:DUF4164 family protein n=1 Tax=Sphingomonas immobilis TaxID=3063997 RepID=A0ABT8ZY18_9SPHN|nr:hypothetical protein [Sphingomonas sp. CA1-15]MDO7842472.1 hypothetical protein [Sphingomonas sp. CA1-15]
MADVSPPAALDRIERAIARIEAAVSNRDRANDTLARRHDALRARVKGALDELDAIIAAGDASGEDAD